MSKLKLTVETISFHRNGISGAGFYAVLFRFDITEALPAWSSRGIGSPALEDARFFAAVFDEPGHVAVICLDLIDEYGIEFAEGNSWRGDHFEDELRDAIRNWPETNRIGPFAY